MHSKLVETQQFLQYINLKPRILFHAGDLCKETKYGCGKGLQFWFESYNKTNELYSLVF